MYLTFLGGATTVTGSQFLLDTGRAKVLIDCGMFQGSPNESVRNRVPFGFEPSELDAVVLTHAHLDHCGLLPVLVREGFSGPIHCTAGTAELVVTQPRLPCFKLGIKMRRDEFVTEFLERGLLGFYLAVAREGEVEAGNPIVELSRDPRGFGVTEIARLYARDRDDVEGMRRAAELDVLPETWRDYFRKRSVRAA